MEIAFANKIEADLHKQMKKVAADRGVDIKTALDQAVRVWLDENFDSQDARLGRKVRAYFSRAALSPETAQVRTLLMSMMGITESDL
jgi:hypothetical protein